ncbi:methyltransferase, FxLD system [Yinghuangia sp. YIM S09857]|uniref:methyltransferase, FxLD system n=1 Tax=Yinghuangia sp. YIM S09857 TaxID=3436929 RepID=UPI003F52F597
MWHQHNIDFHNADSARHLTVHVLAPALRSATAGGLLSAWWFMNKSPWRLRYRSQTACGIPDLLDTLAVDGLITGWCHGVYEPEPTAFGGAEAMQAAHELFHADSLHLLASKPAAVGARETAVLLCSAMMRGAGLDLFEQADVWERVGYLRPGPAPTTARHTKAIRVLMNARPDAVVSADWAAGFTTLGETLAQLAHTGRLTRGLRAVLAHHVIFHANRARLTARDQATLAHLAATSVFHSDEAPRPPTTAAPTPLRSTAVTTLHESPNTLRNALVDHLIADGTLRTPRIEAAFRTVPRHEFLPGVPLDDAYADEAVYVKHDASGVRISAASQPGIVALMLEQLAPQPGDTVFEAGAGTGYNAALLGAIVGADGRVVTVDIDDDLVAGTREHLAASGAKNVVAVCADGALGHPERALYHRGIATVGAFEMQDAWLSGLKPGGRFVAPIRLRGTASRSIAFERDTDRGDRWVSVDSQLAVFMPLRGVGDDARTYVPIAPGIVLQVHGDQDVQVTEGVLDKERHQVWTEVRYAGNESFEWLDLWLSLRVPNSLMRMNVEDDGRALVESGVLAPMFGWGAMATTDGDDLAYLTLRPVETPEGRRYEVGVIGHGSATLTHQVADEIRLWNKDYRDRTVRIEIPDHPETPTADRFVLPRKHHPMTVVWER